jgi:site-specific DNA-cytosine methylase
MRSSFGDSSNVVAAIASKREHSHPNEANELLSLLSTDPSTREYDLNWTQELRRKGKRLRYFTPNELLRLFGFNPPLSKPLKCPHFFVFPEEIALRKQYELIGNSLSVEVVRHLLNRLLVEQ